MAKTHTLQYAEAMMEEDINKASDVLINGMNEIATKLTEHVVNTTMVGDKPLLILVLRRTANLLELSLDKTEKGLLRHIESVTNTSVIDRRAIMEGRK